MFYQPLEEFNNGLLLDLPVGGPKISFLSLDFEIF